MRILVSEIPSLEITRERDSDPTDPRNEELSKFNRRRSPLLVSHALL